MPSDVSSIGAVRNSEWIESQLSAVDFVQWDRYTLGDWNDEQAVSVYGWMDREDEYKDFVLVIFWPESEELYFTTSSDQHTDEIYRRLVGKDLEEHNECRRVENTFGIENAVELQTTLTDGRNPSLNPEPDRSEGGADDV